MADYKLTFVLSILLVCWLSGVFSVCTSCRKRCRANNPWACGSDYYCKNDSAKEPVARCYELERDINDYYVSNETVTWEEAKDACEKRNETLWIIDSQKEQDFVEESIGFEHWIGLKCNGGKDCVWVDGRRLEDGYGFSNWAPNEPGERVCVWIGHYTNKWDDDYCDFKRKYICEL